MDHQACVGCAGCAFGSDSTRKQLPLESQSSGFQARSTQSARPVSTRPAAHLIGIVTSIAKDVRQAHADRAWRRGLHAPVFRCVEGRVPGNESDDIFEI